MRDRSSPLTDSDIGSLDWDKGCGLMPAIVQNADTAQVVMLGYMNREALEATLKGKRATFFSRTRQKLWLKGETSGHFLEVRAVHADCDADTLLVIADPTGPTCHLGSPSCFGTTAVNNPSWLEELSAIVEHRATADPASSYTAQLLANGLLGIAQKVGEEGVELALAGASDAVERCIAETADLLYHVALLMEARGFGWSDVERELESRRKP